MYVLSAEKLLAPTSSGDRGTKTKIYCQGSVCRKCDLAELRTVKLGLREVGNEAKPLKYSENKRSCILFQIRADVQTCDHRPRNVADSDAAEAAMYAQK
jgi:hypothetical protein